LPNQRRWQLQAPVSDLRANECRRDFLASLPHLHCQDSDLFVHGSPRNPYHEYIFPEDIANEPKMAAVFALFDHYCFTGHTHHPGIFTEDGRFLSPEEVGNRYRLDGKKTLVNVGSVGQPRDGDWRACYVLVLDGELIRYRRVEYDVEATVKKIRDNEHLDDFLGERLKDGR
jgi:diadenosine tetraphosphatase ApaH/serine/threonine PP2A family protein phosphatase